LRDVLIDLAVFVGAGAEALDRATIIFGLMAWIFSHGIPCDRARRGRNFHQHIAALDQGGEDFLAFGFLVSSVIERLL